MRDARELVEQFLKALGARDIESALAFYADDCEIVRFEGVASGHQEVRAFLVGFLSAHGRFDLVSIDQFRASGNVVIWDSTLDTNAGVVQTSDVLVLNDEGLIARHMPSLRGYWGQ